MDNNMILIETPVGKIKVTRKGKKGGFPGVWISFIGNDGVESVLSMTEYDNPVGMIATRTYADKDSGEATSSTRYIWTKAQKKPDLKPYEVCVKESYHRNVVVYAENRDAACEKADNLCDTSDIDLDGRDYDGRECEVTGEIDVADVENYQFVFGDESFDNRGQEPEGKNGSEDI